MVQPKVETQGFNSGFNPGNRTPLRTALKGFQIERANIDSRRQTTVEVC